MSIPKPPFHSALEELLYNIYLKLPDVAYLTADDINSIAKLNALILDADLLNSTGVSNAIDNLKGNVPVGGDTLEKLYKIIQGLTYLSQDEIDTLEELNAVLIDADLVRVEDLINSINALKGNVPNTADTLEKLYALLLAGSKNRIIQFEFKSNQFSYHALLFKGQINSLSEDFTNELTAVSYKSRLDTSDSWTQHANLAALQTWVNSNVTGNEITGTKYWIKCVATYKSGQTEEARNMLYYVVAN